MEMRLWRYGGWLSGWCLSVTCKIVTLEKRQELSANGLDRFVVPCLLYSEAKFRDKIPAGSYPAVTSNGPTVPSLWKKRFETNRRLCKLCELRLVLLYYAAPAGIRGPGPHKQNWPPGRGCSHSISYVSLAMCPLKLLGPVLAYFGASTDIMPNHQQKVSIVCFLLVLGMYRGGGSINFPFLIANVGLYSLKSNCP